MILLLPAALADTCESYGKEEVLPPMTDESVDEASGLVELRTRPDIWVTHNDAGGVPALYVFNLDGELLRILSVSGASHDDWEDITAGPCPITDQSCLFIGDIGDNSEDRDSIIVYAVPEPTEDDISLSVEATWEVTWPDGPTDSEALVYHPCDNQLQLITKVSNAPAEIWAFPEEPGKGELSHVAEIDLYAFKLGNYRVTGADWDDTGERLVVRTYSDIMEWRTDPADPAAHWSEAPDIQFRSSTGQLESIAYDHDGNLVSITEGELTRIFRWSCEGLVKGEECPADKEPADTGDSGTPTDTSEPTDTAEPVDSAEPIDSAEPTDSALPTDTGTPDDDTSCGCGTGAASLLPLGLLLWTRRRRR